MYYCSMIYEKIIAHSNSLSKSTFIMNLQFIIFIIFFIFCSTAISCVKEQELTSVGKGFYVDLEGMTYMKSTALCSKGEVDVFIRVPDIDVGTYETIGDWHAKDQFRVYYRWFNTSGGGIATIQSADPKSFSEIAYRLGRDKFHLYSYGEQTPVDVNSMKFIDMVTEYHSKSGFWGSYIKDANAVYVSDFGSIVKLEGADVDTFRCANDDLLLGECHPIDVDNCYFRGKIKLECDSNSFVYVGNGFSKDKNRVYLEEKILKDADAESFRCLGKQLGKKLGENICHPVDKNHYFSRYHVGKIVEGANPATLTPLNWMYAKDTTSVFYRGEKIEGADVSCFSVVRSSYAKDCKNVYHDGRIIPGADVDSFKVLDGPNGGLIALDKNRSYIDGK